MEKTPTERFENNPHERMESARAFLSAAENVVEKTDNETARTILDYMKQNSVVLTVSPTKDPKRIWIPADGESGLFTKDAKPSKQSVVYIYPHHDRDNPYLPANFLSSMHADDTQSAAAYNSHNKFMLLKPSPEKSTFMKGMAFLHEGFHAWWDRSQAEIGAEKWEHERDAHQLSHELARQFGDETYNQILNDHVLIIQQQAAQSGNLVGSQYLKSFKKYDERLDMVFGPMDPPISRKREGGNRMQLLHTHGLFRAIEQDSKSPEEAHQRQADLIKHMYTDRQYN